LSYFRLSYLQGIYFILTQKRNRKQTLTIFVAFEKKYLIQYLLLVSTHSIFPLISY